MPSTLKQKIQTLLTRTPWLYTRLMQLKPNWNREKFVFAKLIQPGETVFDIGANLGIYTQFYSTWVRKEGQVHAFEPVPSTFQELKNNCQTTGCLDNITLNNLGLSQGIGEVPIFIPGDTHGKASMQQHASTSWSNDQQHIQSLTIQTTTLDDYVRSKKINNIHFMKMDIEGAEYLALKGGKETLSTMRPIIHLELFAPWLKEFEYKAEDIFSFLRTLHYDTHITYHDDLKPISNESEIIKQCQEEPLNVVFANRSKHYQQLKNLNW